MASRDKQIEELADAIFKNCHVGLFEDEAKMIAEFCYQEIDRKTSDVAKLEQDVTRLVQEKSALVNNYAKCMKDYAREIFEELNELKKQWASGDMNDDEFYKRLYLLKKKYTEGGE